MTPPLEIEFTVDCDPAHAFDVWSRMSLWWPTDHSFSQHPDLRVTLEPRVGGRIFERTPDGAERDWGEVVAWEPPRRIAYLWHMMAERADATDVEVTFEPGETGTSVRIVHSGWERLGASGAERRERNHAGWSGVLEPYRAACIS